MPTPSDPGAASGALVEALRTLVREEVTVAVRDSVDDSIANAVTELRATIDERLESLPAGGGGGGGGDGLTEEQVIALCPEFCKQTEFQAEIRRQLEEAFQGVLPGLVKRLRGEIEKRIQTGEAGAPGGVLTMDQIVGSSELKEVLEERFRTMLAYLKQEVIPQVIQQRA